MNNKQDLISVIVAIYNKEYLIDECIQSIIEQTYHNLEIILVDDGSTDGSGDICDKYANSDSRILALHKENGGLSDARNAGVDAATGAYIAFVDGDDHLAPTMYETLHKALTESGSDVSMCGHYVVYSDKPAITLGSNGQTTFHSGDDALLGLFSNNIENFHSYDIDKLKLSLRSFLSPNISIFGYVWNKLIKSDIAKQIKFEGAYIEDFFYSYKLYSRIDKLAIVRKPEYYYIQYPDGLGKAHTVASNISRLKIYEEIFHDIIKTYSANPTHFSLAQKKLVISTFLRIFESTIIRTILNYPDTSQKDVHELLVRTKSRLREIIKGKALAAPPSRFAFLGLLLLVLPERVLKKVLTRVGL
ncbi:MAG: glycosyltransferase [Clostridiales Family XIII bacterium]|jgi:glycosyltransferase involved in cell wall biosynthesis|nr:glycosyltransferase [Clostridiales Family XIII bacterium]